MAALPCVATGLLQRLCWHRVLHPWGRGWRWQASSRFNGVSWDKSTNKFNVRLWFDKKTHFLGRFDDEHAAALAFDEALRSLCQDRARLKKSLNFPSTEEERFVESPQEVRSRTLALFPSNQQSEEDSFHRLYKYFNESTTSLAYEIVRISGSSRIDALFQPKGSKTGGIQLQLKSSRSREDKGRTYPFRKADGYEGMLLILIALDRDMLWALPGKLVTQKTFCITLGSDRDREWRVSDIGDVLQSYVQQVQDLPHVTLAEAKLACSANHKVEEQTHALMAMLFSGLDHELKRTFAHGLAVDSRLARGQQAWRVQEKASNLDCKGRHYINLSRSGGALGRRAYSLTDFDLLLAGVLKDGRLWGVFAFPINVLAEHGLVGLEPARLRLCPYWALPKTDITRQKHAWQLEHFVDLRSWAGKLPLPLHVQASLSELLQDAAFVQNCPGRSYAVDFNASGALVQAAPGASMN